MGECSPSSIEALTVSPTICSSCAVSSAAQFAGGKSNVLANRNARSTNTGSEDKDSLGLIPAADSQVGMFNDDLDDSSTREWPHGHISYSDFSKAVDSKTIGSHPKGY